MKQTVNVNKELAIMRVIVALRQIRNQYGCLAQVLVCDNCPIAIICRCIMELKDEKNSTLTIE